MSFPCRSCADTDQQRAASSRWSDACSASADGQTDCSYAAAPLMQTGRQQLCCCRRKGLTRLSRIFFRHICQISQRNISARIPRILLVFKNMSFVSKVNNRQFGGIKSQMLFIEKQAEAHQCCCNGSVCAETAGSDIHPTSMNVWT